MQDSLLNPRQSKYAFETLKNVRLACCMSGKILPSLKIIYFDQTLEMLRFDHNADSTKLKIVRDFLHRATTGQTSSCCKCGLELQELLVVPCSHLVCTECLEECKKEHQCPVCHEEFDPDEIQLLQPGFETNWAQEEESTNRNPRPSNNTILQLNDQDRDERVGSDAAHGDAPLIIGRPAQRRRRLRRGEMHTCEFPDKFVDGRCLLCREEHTCDLMNDARECKQCHRKAEDCPTEETKTSFLVKKIRRLKLLQVEKETRAKRILDAASHFIGQKIYVQQPQPLKVIIFSQFRQTLSLVGNRLNPCFGSENIAEYWGSYRTQELQKFIDLPNCFCILLSNDGSHGLDLSFVTHIIPMDEIWDKSLEDQVIARAYRMGAKGSVELEQLVAKDSLEELMVQKDGASILQQEISATKSFSASKLEKEVKQAKLHYLLTKLEADPPEDPCYQQEDLCS
jgi:SNF2 family DNA or RNA helicase